MAQERENLKENVVDAPTLFIGVGGTGCKIVVRVAEMCKGSESENINFVCLDTNVNDLKLAKNCKSHIYVVQTSNTQTVANYLDYDKDAYDNWFPNNAVLFDKTVSEGAGQVRAISRLAFNSALKMGRLKPLTDAIDNLFRKDGKGFKQAMRVVFATTASGGTGSGIVLPLSMYVRDYVNDKYPNTAVIIRSMILLPETLDSVIDSSVERESQRRNAYATIKEINAFMMLGSGFMDVDEDLKRYHDLHVDYTIPGSDELKRLALLPFDFCFLMDGQNAEDNTMISLEQYVEQAAMALYEQSIGPMQLSAFSMEDNIIKELANPGNYGRNRFGGLGAAAIRYPYDDIADYIAYQWAIDSIGGQDETTDWLRYDKAYFSKKREAEKTGRAMSEMRSRGEIYTETLKSATDPFSKDLRSRFIGAKNEDENHLKVYFNALENYIKKMVDDNSAISSAKRNAADLEEELDYSADGENRGNAEDNLKSLRKYEAMVRGNVENAAESAAEAVFYNEGKTINAREDYTLEQLLHTNAGEICHPNAMRYYLYKAKDEMDARRNSAYKAISEDEDELRTYSSKPGNDEDFDVKYTKAKETSLDALCKAEKKDSDPSFVEKLGGYEKLYEQLNEFFPSYYAIISKFCKDKADYIVYKIGAEYVGKLCEAFEKFYSTFESRTKGLLRLQDDLVDALAFEKGNSTKYVCASREMMDELCRTTQTACHEGNMLDDVVNGQIFDAIKANVAFERETSYMDVVEEDRTIDVFGDVLVEYYKNAVRRDCEEIDLNIIEAIAMEYRLKTRIALREEEKSGNNFQNEEESKIYDHVEHADCVQYILDVVEEGERLAAPSIQRMQNEEPREIRLTAYNKSLLDMRNYNVRDELLKNGSAVDTVSRYELRFYNALYNLTPDKLSKFACFQEKETGDQNAGLYHNAYVKYEQGLGPDSTKNLAISTHIDKRWDSVAVLPEIDLGYQKQCVMNIHQAMIYGLVHDLIKFIRSSRSSDNKKKVYVYENSQDRREELVVSNGTDCDQFYEILDALYINPAVVKDIEIRKAQKREKNEVRQSNYYETTFKRDLEAFSIEGTHVSDDESEDSDEPKDAEVKKEQNGSSDSSSPEENEKDKTSRTSLFEIPLVYYNSMPNSMRYDSEIEAMVEAVIQVFADEFNRWESEEDIQFLLCEELVDQFHLLIDNYNEFDALNRGIPVSSNDVLDIVFRKIKHVIEDAEPDDYMDIIEGMKDRLK